MTGWVLAAGLAFLCLLINYIVWSCSYSVVSAILWIVTFDSAILLAYKFLGPIWVYWAFWKVVEYTWYTGYLIWTYPYYSASVICGLFVFGTLYSIYTWRNAVVKRLRQERQERTIMNIDERLKRMEEQQNRIVEQNKEIKAKLSELLTRLSSENSR